VAFYFSWANFYTTWLIIAGIMGNLDSSCHFQSHPHSGAIFTPIELIVDFDIPAVVFSIFITLWATAMLEFWKRREGKNELFYCY